LLPVCDGRILKISGRVADMPGIRTPSPVPSTADQEAGLEAQIRDLKAAGCAKIFNEQVSSIAERTELGACARLRSWGRHVSRHQGRPLSSLDGWPLGDREAA
jgi:hypothetical protein